VTRPSKAWPARLRPSRSLRLRLVLWIAVLAGTSILAGASASYLAARAELRHQIDESLLLLSQVPPPAPPPEQCVAVPPQVGGRDRLVVRAQVVDADGSVCTVDGGPALPVAAADLAIARSGRGTSLRDVTVAGEPMRLRTVAIGDGHAIQFFRSTREMNQALRRLARFLAAATALTLVLVALLGGLLARRLLRPVETLTRAAERIAATGLEVPIEVTGHDEVGRLSAAFRHMTLALAEARRRQRQLVADAGHELRSPLTSLRTNVELLARSRSQGRPLAAGEELDLCAAVVSQTDELAHLVDELVELAQDHRHDEATGFADVDLGEVVSRALDRVRLRSPQTPFVRTGDGTAIQLRAHPASLERALVNVLDNAVKFSPPDEPVGVDTRAEGGWVTVTVADSGRGVAEEDLPRVFDRFWRAADAQDHAGSGLGLAIVQQTAHLHDGDVEIRRRASGGVAVTIRLPRPA